MYWFPLLVFIPHILEEYRRFPAWSTKHFGATSRAWYVYSHIVLIAVAIPVCRWAENSAPQSLARVFGTALIVSPALNGAFHIITTILFREYSPGVVTGIFLFFPTTGYLLFRTVQEALLTRSQLCAAIAIGTLVQIAAIASLYLPMNIDWRCRRLTHEGTR